MRVLGVAEGRGALRLPRLLLQRGIAGPGDHGAVVNVRVAAASAQHGGAVVEMPHGPQPSLLQVVQ